MQVIFETSRLATIVNGVLRKTTEDTVLNGMAKGTLLSFTRYDTNIKNSNTSECACQDLPSPKVGEYMFIQGKLTMIHYFIQSL